MKSNELRNLIKKEVRSLLTENIAHSSQITPETDIEELRAYVEQCLMQTEQKIINAGKNIVVKSVIKQTSQARDYSGTKGMAVKQISLTIQGFSEIKQMVRWYWDLSEEFNEYLYAKTRNPGKIDWALDRLKATLGFLGC